ncbi:unnamed protein product [Paramecium octaurelia]|uniref:Transmembrane protein n=1 Tax=Paramecium octaurelia TaxID=43137 RepID=A0A8S1YS14_PAROT|nr:unnamed protein product [Paramecium octaurelia]
MQPQLCNRFIVFASVHNCKMHWCLQSHISMQLRLHSNLNQQQVSLNTTCELKSGSEQSSEIVMRVICNFVYLQPVLIPLNKLMLILYLIFQKGYLQSLYPNQLQIYKLYILLNKFSFSCKCAILTPMLYIRQQAPKCMKKLRRLDKILYKVRNPRKFIEHIDIYIQTYLRPKKKQKKITRSIGGKRLLRKNLQFPDSCK